MMATTEEKHKTKQETSHDCALTYQFDQGPSDDRRNEPKIVASPVLLPLLVPFLLLREKTMPYAL